MNVISWTRGIENCLSLSLDNILEDIRLLKTSFNSFSCRHVYKEHNKEADRKSKEGLQIDLGRWKITENQNGHLTYFFTDPS